MAGIYLGLVTLFREFGIETAVITLRDLSEEQLAQLHSFSLILGFLAFLLSCMVAIPLGLFFRAPKLPIVLVITSLGFIVMAYRTVPYSLLQREMRFKLLALLDGLQVLAQALVTITLALLGFKFWALVIGGLVGTTASSVLPFVWRPQRYARPRWRSIERPLTYSWHVFVSRVCWWAYETSDLLVVGRVLGAAPLGAYSIASNLAHVPMEKFSTLVNRVTPSLFAAVQNDSAALRRYLRNMTEAVALVTFPMTFGIALVAPEFVHLVFGEKWIGVIIPLQLLAAYASLRCIRTLLSPLLNAVGNARFVMMNTVLSLIVFPASFYLASRWGTTGVASCWVIVYPIVSLPLFRFTFRRISMPVSQYFNAIRPALAGSLTMTVVVLALKWALPEGWPLHLRFSLEILSGGTAYLLTLFGLDRERLRAFFQLIRLLRSQAE